MKNVDEFYESIKKIAIENNVPLKELYKLEELK